MCSLVRIALAVAGVLTFASAAATDAAAAQGTKQVLVLYATRRDSLLAGVGDRELARFLGNALSQQLDYYTEYIDLTRFPDPEYQAAFREFLGLKYRDQHFDLLIAVEEASLEFVDKNREKLFPGTPVVFFALSPETRRIANSTGVLAELAFTRTLRLATALQPDIQQVFVVSGASPRDRFYESLARKQFHTLEGKVAITYLSGLPAREVEERLSALPARSIIYYLIVSQDGAGVNFRPLEYLDRLAPIVNQPIYSWDDSTIGHGVVGGSLRHLEGGIDVLAQQALKVLRGQKADSIPISTADVNVTQVDWRQLQRWNIPEQRVPSGSVIKFREESAWARYRGYILGALVLLLAQSALLAGLIIQRAKRRKAEAKVRLGQAELRTSFDRIRELGVRLLGAQEAERSRIARELHDDISQQLAVLAIDLQSLTRFGRNQIDDGRELARVAVDRVQGIAKSVHELSHRLHPAKLRLIGLVGALRSLQRELARNDVDITFTHDNVPPALPQDLALSLFRVVEEALQNAVKHGGARKISVHLDRHDDALTLTIADDGIGFDLGAAWGKGLGLISMHERLEAMGGTLTIQSKAGAGTCLEAIVQLREAQTIETVA